MSDTIQVDLGRGYFATVDANLWEQRLRHYVWRPQIHRKKGVVYAYTNLGCNYGMHRMIMDAPRGLHVDHINGNGLDNRRCNLRLCTPSQNSANKHTPTRNRTSYIGLWWSECNQKWAAQIRTLGKKYHLGLFKCPRKAAQAYDIAALAIWGEFARINFPDNREAYVPKMPRMKRPRKAHVDLNSQSATIANGSH